MSSKALSITLFVLLIVVVGIGIFYLKGSGVSLMLGGGAMKDANSTSTTAMLADPSPSDYQAVFLNNGQVYFGKLSNMSSQFVTLKDIYYLQVNQQIQPATKDGKATTPDISLVKLGGELHGPTDEMQINRDQVLLVENLRSDSNVVRAIKTYKTQ